MNCPFRHGSIQDRILHLNNMNCYRGRNINVFFFPFHKKRHFFSEIYGISPINEYFEGTHLTKQGFPMTKVPI